MDKWNNWYKELDQNNPGSYKYGDTLTYEKGFNWLKSCSTIEDWGCGAGGFKRFFTKDVKNKYVGIDGSLTPFSNVKADLTQYQSSVEGIFMRHILEHNFEWEKILDNACKSFTEKFYLVLFTPFSDSTRQIADNAKHGVDVPDMSFSKQDIINVLTRNNCVYKLESVHTNTYYGIEHIFYITKKDFVAYYTCFTGKDDNESFAIPPLPSDVYNCYYFTNNLSIYEALKGTKWIRKFIYEEPSDNLNVSNMQAKPIKILPHNHSDLCKYTYTVWLDSKLGGLDDDKVLEVISENMLDNDMMLRYHPYISDSSIWSEFNLSITSQERYKALEEQFRTYIDKQLSLGFKEITDWHVCCGFIIRKMNENTRAICDEWYKQILDCGIQDQLSFFIVKQMFTGIAPFHKDIIKYKKLYDF
jgi:hypothetical protein